MDGNCRAVIVTAALHSPALKGAFPFAVKGKLSACLQATCQAPAYTCQAPAYKQGNLTALLRHVQILVLCFNTQGSCEEGGRKEGRKEEGKERGKEGREGERRKGRREGREGGKERRKEGRKMLMVERHFSQNMRLDHSQTPSAGTEGLEGQGAAKTGQAAKAGSSLRFPKVGWGCQMLSLSIGSSGPTTQLFPCSLPHGLAGTVPPVCSRLAGWPKGGLPYCLLITKLRRWVRRHRGLWEKGQPE